MSTTRRSLRHMLPSLHGLMVFEASARLLNFSKAADELAITQSAVSHAVRQLEASLGYPLFLREGRTLALTSQGQRLYLSVSGGFGVRITGVCDPVMLPPCTPWITGDSPVTVVCGPGVRVVGMGPWVAMKSLDVFEPRIQLALM